ncbi:unnamed protein product [Heterobilharzia americana]|nr:unnamed protein product [Heterobilharzia americana]
MFFIFLFHRTSSKIVLANDGTEVMCTFCHYPLCDTTSSDIDPDRLATESMKHSASLSNPTGCSKEIISEGVNKASLCYSCSLMFEELSHCT